MIETNSTLEASCRLGEIIDLERYPIANPASEKTRAFADLCKRRFAETGALSLPGFIKSEVVQELISTVEQSKSKGHKMAGEFTPYSDNLSEGENENLPENHPRRFRLSAAHTFLAGDILPIRNPLKIIYQTPELIHFVASVIGDTSLYTIPDSLGCINQLVYEPGDSNGWHFDTNEFVLSIMLRSASEGGEYQYIPDLRSPENENHDDVVWRMQNPDDPNGVKTVTLSPGSLFLFRGKYTLHRVTPVRGDVDRVIAILNYHSQPDHQISEGSKLAMYGRAA